MTESHTPSDSPGARQRFRQNRHRRICDGACGAGVEILCTGNTHRMLAEAGITVREVADYTGFPELMDGRVKTLHPKIHGGILGAARH